MTAYTRRGENSRKGERCNEVGATEQQALVKEKGADRRPAPLPSRITEQGRDICVREERVRVTDAQYQRVIAYWVFYGTSAASDTIPETGTNTIACT